MIISEQKSFERWNGDEYQREYSSLAVKLFAGADFDLSVTFFALHKATPMKLALASFNPFFASGSVSTIAAHKFAPINARTSLKYENEISMNCSRKNGLICRIK